jgi:Na+/H+ antiporter NhaD/arsenite permease-like protein
MSTQLKIFLGMVILGVVGGIFLMIREPSITKLLSLVGFICTASGLLWRQGRFLQMTPSQIHQEALAGHLPRRAPWQTALLVIGLGLFVLAQWRGCSGLH